MRKKTPNEKKSKFIFIVCLICIYFDVSQFYFGVVYVQNGIYPTYGV